MVRIIVVLWLIVFMVAVSRVQHRGAPAHEVAAHALKPKSGIPAPERSDPPRAPHAS